MSPASEIIQGDCREVLAGMAERSVQCVITSPPYWGLRDYGVDGQLGLEATPAEYIERMVGVFRAVRRALRDDGTLWLNMGDAYAGSFGAQSKREGEGVAAVHVDRMATQSVTRNPRAIGLKPKDLIGMPWRLAFALQADGWYLRSDIIWAKPNPMPESCTDRPTKAHEYLFLFTKSGAPRYWTHRDQAGCRTKPKADWRWVSRLTGVEVTSPPEDWKEIIRCPNCDSDGLMRVDTSYDLLGRWIEQYQLEKCDVCNGSKRVQKYARRNLWRGHDYFWDAEAVREGVTGGAHARGSGVNPKCAEAGSGIKQNVSFSGAINELVGCRNIRTVWTIPTQSFPEAHFATFPEKLVLPCIRAGTSEKGCCPECGAPWVRVVEKPKPPPEVFTKTRKPIDGYVNQMLTLAGPRGYGQKLQNWMDANPPTTTGWRPGCECMEQVMYTDGSPSRELVEPVPVPCVCLDPFAGGGTVGVVCARKNRAFVGIELNPDYVKMAEERIGKVMRVANDDRRQATFEEIA